jgi:3-polyprenyl-4-hydroxybenzoate decarboxylase
MMMMMGDDYDNDDDDAADDDDDDHHHHHHDLTHDINSEQGTETRVVLSPCSLSCRSKKHICVDNVPICTIKC